MIEDSSLSMEASVSQATSLLLESEEKLRLVEETLKDKPKRRPGMFRPMMRQDRHKFKPDFKRK